MQTPNTSQPRRGLSAITEKFRQEDENREQRAASRNMPFRFWLGKGESAQVLILDNDTNFMRREHCIVGPSGKRDTYVECVADIPGMQCEHCKAQDYSYMAVFLTILDLRPYNKTDANGVTVEVPYTRRLLPIKKTVFDKYRLIFEKAITKHGTLRGTLLTLTRSTADTGAAIGEPSPFDDINGNTVVYEHLPEEEILECYGHGELTNKKGEVYLPVNGRLQALDYESLYPSVLASTPAPQHPAPHAIPGSRAFSQAVPVTESSDEDDDEIPGIPSTGFQRHAEQAASTNAAPVNVAPAEEPQAAAPVRRRGAPAAPPAAPAPTTAVRRGRPAFSK